MPYTVRKDLRPSKLDGVSEDQIDQHWALYEGYVEHANALHEAVQELEPGEPEWAELKRRFGFEFDGMVLHELYFGNLGRNGPLPPGGGLGKALSAEWGSAGRWRKDFEATGMMRGAGWAILYHDPAANRLFNWWIGDHELFHPVSFQPLLVMDVWEHAYMVDFGAAGRKEYVEAFFRNVHWDVVEQRFAASHDGRVVNRFEHVSARR